MRDSDEIRNQRWVKLRDTYIPSKFHKMVCEELLKYETKYKHKLSFTIDLTKWTIVTKIPSVYYPTGFLQKDEKEYIEYIEAEGIIVVDGTPRGPLQKIKFSPLAGFHGLDGIIQGALYDDSDALSVPVDEQFTLGSIEIENKFSSKQELLDRIEATAKALIGMGYRYPEAAKMANTAVAENPGITEPSALVDVILASI